MTFNLTLVGIVTAQTDTDFSFAFIAVDVVRAEHVSSVTARKVSRHREGARIVVWVEKASHGEEMLARPRTVLYYYIAVDRTGVGSTEFLTNVSAAQQLFAWHFTAKISNRHMTLDTLFVPTQGHGLLYWDTARTASLMAAFWAFVLKLAENFNTWLVTRILLMLPIRWMTFFIACVTTTKTKTTFAHAATFG